MGLKVSYAQKISEVVNEYPQTQFPLDEFADYKKICLEYADIPAPPIHEQLKHPAHIETIGRDKLMERPSSARAEELHHVHMWQEGCCWEDPVKGLKVQWASTSNCYVVYSYFKDKNQDHHFYIIDYCGDLAHDIIEDDDQVMEWAEEARSFRIANI
jgi:hypothetical protein